MSTDESRTTATVDLPKGVSFSVAKGRLTVKGPLGSTSRPFPADALSVATSGSTLTLTLKLRADLRTSKALLHTWEAHARNLAGGVTLGVTARLKAVAAHFPMKVAAKDGSLLIENFLGEKHPRSAPLLPGVTAAVDGEFVILSGHDVEEVGQSAANIERATRIRDYDPRVFQDGIYIVDRAHLKEAA